MYTDMKQHCNCHSQDNFSTLNITSIPGPTGIASNPSLAVGPTFQGRPSLECSFTPLSDNVTYFYFVSFVDSKEKELSSVKLDGDETTSPVTVKLKLTRGLNIADGVSIKYLPLRKILLYFTYNAWRETYHICSNSSPGLYLESSLDLASIWDRCLFETGLSCFEREVWLKKI